MAKKEPAWIIQGLPGPPPVINGYHHYEGWTAADGPQREPLSHALRIGAWSLRYWWTKVAKDIWHGAKERTARGTHPLG